MTIAKAYHLIEKVLGLVAYGEGHALLSEALKELDTDVKAEYHSAIEALHFYADPETYHAVSFRFDRPCGSFYDDFNEDHGHWFYEREMPGKLARETLSNLGFLK